jgi:hypothetical protein
MTDLLTLLEILRRRKWSLGFFLVLLLGGYYLTGGERLRYMESSPDYFYRLEVYSPYRYQYPIAISRSVFDIRDYVFIRLYSNLPGNRFLGETPLVSDRESATTRLWDQWESGLVSAGMSNDEKDTEFAGIPPIDPATRQALPVSQRTVVVFSDPEVLERVANLDGNEALCDAQRVVETHGKTYHSLQCPFYPPPYPPCVERPEGEAELCRIEAARNHDTSYRMALSNLYCRDMEANLDHFAGKRIARDIAWAYKAAGCGLYVPEGVPEGYFLP